MSCRVFAVMTLAVGVLGASVVAQVEPLALSLDEAIASALANDESLEIERASLSAAQAGVLGAEGAYDPRLSVSAGYLRATEPVNSAFSGAPDGEPAPTQEALGADGEVQKLLATGGEVTVRGATDRSETDGAFGLLSPAYSSTAGVELRQPLLRDRTVDAGRLGLRVSAADRDLATASLRRQVRDTVLGVERGYWDLAAAQRAVEVRAEAVELAAAQLDETMLRIESGLTPQAERSQPEAELERRRGELLASREAVARADNLLKLLVLGDEEGSWLRPISPVDEPSVELMPVDLAGALATALARRPEIEAAGAVIDRRRAETQFAADRVRPALDLVLSHDRFGLTGSSNAAATDVPGLGVEPPPELAGGWGSSFDALLDGDFDRSRVTLALELPLRNRTAQAEAEIARAAERTATAQLAGVRKRVRAEVLDAAARVETTAARIDAARAALRAAEVQLAAERDRFEVGLSTNFLVLTRQNDLADAQLQEIQALTDYRRARAELAGATGTLLEEHGIDLLDATGAEEEERRAP